MTEQAKLPSDASIRESNSIQFVGSMLHSKCLEIQFNTPKGLNIYEETSKQIL